MSREAEQLLEAALALPESERAALVMRLLDSMRDDASVSEAQATESASRLAALHAGELDVVDDDEAMSLING